MHYTNDVRFPVAYSPTYCHERIAPGYEGIRGFSATAPV